MKFKTQELSSSTIWLNMCQTVQNPQIATVALLGFLKTLYWVLMRRWWPK